MLLARFLGRLATNHIFTEVSPDVFAINRLSSVLYTGDSVEELLATSVLSFFGCIYEKYFVGPELKHIGTLGITSLFEHTYELLLSLSRYNIRPQCTFIASMRASKAAVI